MPGEASLSSGVRLCVYCGAFEPAVCLCRRQAQLLPRLFGGTS